MYDITEINKVESGDMSPMTSTNVENTSGKSEFTSTTKNTSQSRQAVNDGGYAVPVGETVGTPNKLVIKNGDISNPSVETVFEINYNKETISTTSIIGEYLHANRRQGLYQQKQNAEKIYGHGCIIEYSVSNSGYVRGENGRGKGVIGTKGGKSNGNSKQGVRYHWDAEGNFVKYSKKDSTGRSLTDAQIKYFADSKIRDEDGNLLVVYHGTDADFTVFDRTKSRVNMDI